MFLYLCHVIVSRYCYVITFVTLLRHAIVMLLHSSRYCYVITFVALLRHAIVMLLHLSRYYVTIYVLSLVIKGPKHLQITSRCYVPVNEFTGECYVTLPSLVCAADSVKAWPFIIRISQHRSATKFPTSKYCFLFYCIVFS